MRPFLRVCARTIHTRPIGHYSPITGSLWCFRDVRRAWYSQRGNNKAAQNEVPPPEGQTPPKGKKKGRTGSQSSKNSLRRVAAQAGRGTSGAGRTKDCTAYCTAEKYDLVRATRLLVSQGYAPDPFLTGLGDQVIHLRLPIPSSVLSAETGYLIEHGDIFVFPSGNVVSWSLPPSVVSSVATVIRPAADTTYAEADVETEDLEYVEDSRIRRSRVGGDVIILGTASSENLPFTEHQHPRSEGEKGEGDTVPATAMTRTPTDELNITLAKVAFSSGLARSTKLAVLESLLDDYLTTTSSIPQHLSRGSKLPFTRSFILRKTGQLLEFRARLNLYSELTDSLPDIFWDSRHELGLEGYYESVGRALDVDARIKQLNAKLDYASGIVEVLRERLSERHSLLLEWMIIVLIAIEVGFEVRRLWEEARVGEVEAREYREWRERREREGDVEFQRWRGKGGAR